MTNRYYCENKGVKVSFKLFENGIKGVLIIPQKFKHKLSAIHIHKNIGGKPGPILFWLATSNEWQIGVKQLTPGTNSPCSTNSYCNLIAPRLTPLVKAITGYTSEFNYDFKIIDCLGKKCNVLENFGDNFLVIHGKKFQTIHNGCLSHASPGLDILAFSKLLPLPNKMEEIGYNV